MESSAHGAGDERAKTTVAKKLKMELRMQEEGGLRANDGPLLGPAGASSDAGNSTSLGLSAGETSPASLPARD